MKISKELAELTSLSIDCMRKTIQKIEENGDESTFNKIFNKKSRKETFNTAIR